MRIQVEHDKQGAITAVAVLTERPGQVAHVALRPRPGHNVVYVEAHDVVNEHDLQTILELKRNCRVEHTKQLHRLVRK